MKNAPPSLKSGTAQMFVLFAVFGISAGLVLVIWALFMDITAPFGGGFEDRVVSAMKAQRQMMMFNGGLALLIIGTLSAGLSVISSHLHKLVTEQGDPSESPASP